MANDFQPRFVRRMRWSLALLVTGLGIEVATLMRAHPYTFLTFLFVGTGLALIGTLGFLWAWLTR
jgi:hypothetical protein